MKNTLFAALIFTAAVASSGIASAATKSAYCHHAQSSTKLFVGRGETYYYTSGGYDIVDHLRWHQEGAGNKSNVKITHGSKGSSPSQNVFYSYKSGNMKKDTFYTHYPKNWKVATSRKTRTDFHFYFDVNNAADPDCHAYTPYW